MKFVGASVPFVKKTDPHDGTEYVIYNHPVNLEHVWYFSKTSQTDWDSGYFIQFRFPGGKQYWAYETEEARDTEYDNLINMVL